MRYKARLLATVSSLAILGAVTSALAADLPVKAIVKAPIIEAPFSWTGFYVGVHGGVGWLDHRQTTTGNFNPNGACDYNPLGPFSLVTHCQFRPLGVLAGGHVGANWQSGKVVYGLELDGSWLDLKQSERFTGNPIPGGQTLVTTEVNWLATGRGRLGLAFSPTLVYVTGGVAVGGVNSGWSAARVNPAFCPCGIAVDKTKVGWVGGGGIEHAFNRNWSIRAEALYHDLGTDSVRATLLGVGNNTYTTNFRHRLTTARVGLTTRW